MRARESKRLLSALRPMKVVAKILLYLLGVVLLSSLVAPPLYRLGRAVVDAGILPQLAPFGFPKYFNRAFLVVGVASLWPFLRWLGLSRWTELGLEPNPGRFRDLGLGFAIGSIGLWCVAAGLMLSGQAAFDDRSVPWLGLLVVVATATVVPLIEEPFFRGALLGLLRRALPWRAALVFLSFLFAVMHFVKPQPGSPPIDDVRWHSGFELFTRVFWQFGRPESGRRGMAVALPRWLDPRVLGRAHALPVHGARPALRLGVGSAFLQQAHAPNCAFLDLGRPRHHDRDRPGSTARRYPRARALFVAPACRHRGRSRARPGR